MIKCPENLENLINDYDTFINGEKTDTVILSDSIEIDSYRKYAIAEILKPGSLYNSTYTYQKDDIVSFDNNVFVCLKNCKDIDTSDKTYWKAIKTDAVVEGYGIAGYVSFLLSNLTILYSKNVNSVAVSDDDDISIIIDIENINSSSGKIISAISNSNEETQFPEDSADNSDYKIKFGLYTRELENDPSTGLLKFKTNRSTILQNTDCRVDIFFISH